MQPAPAGPQLFPPQVALHAVKLACERPDTCGRSLCLWDCQEIARQLVREAITPAISTETVRPGRDALPLDLALPRSFSEN